MTVLARVPVDKISARAVKVHPGKVLLAWLTAFATAVAGLLYLVGWAPAKFVRGLIWLGSAVAEGWVDGFAKAGGDG